MKDNRDRAAFGQRKPGETLPGSDGLHQVSVRISAASFKPWSVRVHHRLLAGNEDRRTPRPDWGKQDLDAFKTVTAAPCGGSFCAGIVGGAGGGRRG